MKLKIKKIKELIILDETKNSEKKIDNVLGINISKKFMPTIANLNETDISKYKILKKNNFACNIMHVGRDERLPIALYKSDTPALISPAYKVFSVRDEREIIPEFLMIFFERSEFDRLTWFFCDSSIRGGLEWERFEEIEIPVPEDLKDQRTFVEIYTQSLRNLNCFDESLGKLEFICSSLFQELKNTEESVKLGDHIREVVNINSNLDVKRVRGISSVTKTFMKPKANMTGVDISDYKIVSKHQFAYIPITSRSGNRMSIALNLSDDCIVSKIYPVFEVIDQNLILPEYLYLFFIRAEFDRYARYHSWGSARETFDWQDMCDVKIPIPNLKVQQSLITFGKVLNKRKKISIKLNELIKSVCPILFKGIINYLEPNLSIK